MKRLLSSICCTLCAAALLGGCALYPAVQVAGGAMTGYDAVVLADEYYPRDHVEGGSLRVVNDTMLQRRLRERLKLNGMTVTAHVVNAEAYLMGEVRDRKHADYAIETARTVQGIRTITCKFYPAGTPKETGRDIMLRGELEARLKHTKRFHTSDLRVEVFRGHAILIGRTDTWEQKTAAMAIAGEMAGILEVVDYLKVGPCSTGSIENEESTS